MNGKSILLIIGGGIAAYKSLDLIRRARERGARVRAVLTPGAEHFVTPLSVATLCEEKAFTDLFDLKDETEIGHIRLSREADIIIVAPATANLLARMANGLADDLATSVLLAANKPILAAPAMNWKMWDNPATRRNLAQLRADGVHFVGPGEGAMACNEFGVGRMAEVAEILDAAELLLRSGEAMPLKGAYVLVTAGPTHEPIDPVRYIANRSSGKQGYAIASAAAKLGARVTLVSGPVGMAAPHGVDIVRVETARDMLAAVQNALPADIGVFAAAVADWRSAAEHEEKLKKAGKGKTPALALVENPDILATIAKHRTLRPSLVIGFAAETENVVSHARKKLASKGCDWIVANDVSAEKGVMGGSRNEVHLVTAGGVENWPQMPKEAVAEALMQRAAAYFGARGRGQAAAAE
ncbi:MULTISPECIES: bifunctional phosphopantothenoylcysteine decarboxylase/phosphopantothenate--cysteine ligase CoaBC [Rhodomicrobium]|uniref:bifunctional phosphopantothenoylcysteine decarboxylase/phosphopantothenate--cysteine ligase CoaBC n=1 Tax=Rhodomicrobium TaxID=1068 RepID=UPI000B4A736F|nr:MULTISPECIES: bifunctional phosphopantothenoylcysteine decarboxylase/phosphopantothenate--cysteine ligase CoaBC [Rhodomicrobium]